MASNVYEITVELKPVEGGGQANGEEVKNSGDLSPDTNDADSDKEEAAQSSRSRMNPAKAIAAKLVKQTATTALANYGNISGDYVAQQNMQTLIGEAASVAGAVAMGPVGIALYAIDKGVQAFNYISQIKRSEAEAAFRQERVYASTRKA